MGSEESRFKRISSFFTRKRLAFLGIFLCILVGLGLGWESITRFYPPTVGLYKYRYQQMSTQEEKEALLAFASNNLSDPIEGLDWDGLLLWESRYLVYTRDYLEIRSELPIPILTSNMKDGVAHGRCGEFSLLYAGLCLANEIPVRIVTDVSYSTLRRFESSWIVGENDSMYFYFDFINVYYYKENSFLVYVDGERYTGPYVYSYIYLKVLEPLEKGTEVKVIFEFYTRAGDHIWNEVLIDGEWIHIDTTQICTELKDRTILFPQESEYFDSPMVYVEKSHKEVNRVYAFNGTSIEDVTVKYGGL